MRLQTLLAALLVVIFWGATADAQTEGQTYVFHPKLEVHVASLPSVVADSATDADVLAASVAITVQDPEICCGRNSVLTDQVGSLAKFSLKELGEKVRGKHYLESGSSIVITDKYWPGAATTPEEILGRLLAQQPLLMLWNGRLYVLYGAVFDEYLYDGGTSMRSIQKLLLLDTRFDDDRRRNVTFDRQTDDWSKVSGLLSLSVTR